MSSSENYQNNQYLLFDNNNGSDVVYHDNCNNSCNSVLECIFDKYENDSEKCKKRDVCYYILILIIIIGSINNY